MWIWHPNDNDLSRNAVLPQTKEGVEHVNIGDEGIDTTNLVAAKQVDIG
jgi:hypothetical protein